MAPHKRRVARKRPLTTIPGVFAKDGPFTVEQLSEGTKEAASSSDGRVLRVPLDNSVISVALRAHEYGHLLVSREMDGEDVEIQKSRKFTNRVYQSGLDHVVNTTLRERGVNEVLGLVQGKPGKYAKIDELMLGALRGIAIEDVRHMKKLKPNQREDVKLVAAELMISLEGGLKMLMALLEEAVEKEESQGWMIPKGMLSPPPSTESSALGERGLIKGVLPHLHKGLHSHWGPMEFEEVEKTQELVKKSKQMMKKGFVGAFRYPLRALIPAFDGRCFGTKKKSKRRGIGAMLVDCSGSMTWSPKDLLQLVKENPHVVVGLYGGFGNTRGELRIVVRNGWMASDREVGLGAGSGANTVDGPALKWLSMQKGPKVWVSDQGVHGMLNSDTHALRQECTEICRKSRIKIVDKLDLLTTEELPFV
jgi:hypothetical protein